MPPAETMGIIAGSRDVEAARHALHWNGAAPLVFALGVGMVTLHRAMETVKRRTNEPNLGEVEP